MKKLMERLRERAAWINFPHHGEESQTEDAKLMMDAADAIEELIRVAGVNAKRALKWASDAEKEAAKQRWIPVTERLPEDRHDVLVYAGLLFPYITVGYYDGLWKFSFNDEEIAGGSDYWMPLPEPPKEE